jgi:hypothetical protein
MRELLAEDGSDCGAHLCGEVGAVADLGVHVEGLAVTGNDGAHVELTGRAATARLA